MHEPAVTKQFLTKFDYFHIAIIEKINPTSPSVGFCTDLQEGFDDHSTLSASTQPTEQLFLAAPCSTIVARGQSTSIPFALLHKNHSCL